MASWKLNSTENVIRSILNNSCDIVANEYALTYIKNCTEDLLIFAIDNQNEQFIKQSFKVGIYMALIL